MVKNPPSNAGDTGLVPDVGTEFPHAAGQLIPCSPEKTPSWKRKKKPGYPFGIV